LYARGSVKVGNQTGGATGASYTVRYLVGRAREAADVVLVESSSAAASESVRANRSRQVTYYSARWIERKAELASVRSYEGLIQITSGKPSAAAVREHLPNVLALVLNSYKQRVKP